MMEERDEVFVTFDGQAGFQLEAGDEIRIRRADQTAAPDPPVDAQLLRGAARETEVGRTITDHGIVSNAAIDSIPSHRF